MKHEDKARLEDFAQQVGLVEEQHNEVLDSLAELRQTQSQFVDEALADAKAIRETLSALRQDIQMRIAWAKRASTILSLIAQSEELTPIKTRIQKQRYEHFASRDWFKKQLQN